MTTYVVQRLLQAAVVIFLITVITFLIIHLLPGDPIRLLLSQNDTQNSTELIEKMHHEFGLDKPLPEQYMNWLSGVFRGDFGISILQHTPVMRDISRRVPITLHIGLLALVISVIIGIPAGIICAVRRGKWIDSIITVLTNLGVTIPSFWLGILLMYLLALKLMWLPPFGYTSPATDFWLSTKQVIMPVICLAVFPLAVTARQTRSTMLEVMRQDYIRTAWSKGLQEKLVVTRHALKNALIPVITLISISLSHVIGGSVLIETVFNIPGMGRLLITSVLNKDYPYVQGIILIFAVTILLLNIIVDISYGWLDPRIRYE
jgi:peptide/nickel transport system permease protein